MGGTAALRGRRSPGLGPGPHLGVLLCFIRADVMLYRVGTEVFPRGHRTHSPLTPGHGRELRRPPLFLTDHYRVPGTTIRGSQWGPASALPQAH